MSSTANAEHWHVVRHSEDDDPFVTTDLFAAIEYAADELDHLCDFEHDGMIASKEAGQQILLENGSSNPWAPVTHGPWEINALGMFRDAWDTYDKIQGMDNAMQNARNIVKQHDAVVNGGDPAPLYTGDDALEMLTKSAAHVVEAINRDSSISINSCFWSTDDPDMVCYNATHDPETGELYESDGEPEAPSGA